MKTEQIINKETKEVLKTNDGIELTRNTFEIGDIFIPVKNRIISNVREVNVKGKPAKITDNKLIANVKDVNGIHEEVFITLTPTQVRSIQKRIDEGLEINQHEWVVYEYESKTYGPGQVGVGLKSDTKKPITFSE
jgi:hypothetical protein